MAFSELGLSVSTQRVTAAVHYKTPTPIQEQAIPRILEGADLIAQAQTGTGKTAAFALPILQQLNDLPPQNKPWIIRTLILAPTRELAQQVAQAFETYAKYMPREIRVTSIIGGEDIVTQIARLRSGVEIVVATPGRLLELLREDKIILDDLLHLVLDEGDKLLALGFAAEIDDILERLPKERQNLLFSATYPEKVMQLSEKVTTNPLHVNVASDEPLIANITQRVIEVNRENRGPLLRHLIKQNDMKHVLIFTASKRAAHNLAEKLKRANIRADALHGDLDQDERSFVLRQFKNRNIDILVATDIAARGIDIQKLTHVINFDLPRSPLDYIHRIGRTGRAGSKGIAISFIGHEDQAHFKLIEKRSGIRLEREQVPGFELKGDALERQKGAPPVKGKRPSKKDKARAAAKELERQQAEVSKKQESDDSDDSSSLKFHTF